MRKSGFTPLEKATDLNRWLSPLKANGGFPTKSGIPLEREKPPSVQTVRERSSLTGFTLVEIMIVISVIVLLLAIAIPNVLRARANANNSVARSTLRAMATATEAYAAANAGIFPTSEATLTSVNPPYLNRSYCGGTYTGFSFTCTWGIGGYTFTAAPTAFGFSGTNTYTITTGGVLTPAN